MVHRKFWRSATLILITFLTVTGMFEGISHRTQVQAASLAIENWWPTQNATLQGVQPFKALLQQTPVEQYTMYWSVDGGSLVPMDSNYTDYPHKEASVDVSSWNWKGTGPYNITFTAKDSRGIVLSEKTISIYTTNTNPTNSGSLVSSPLNKLPLVKNPLSSLTLFINPDSPAKKQADVWRASRPTDASLMDKIAKQPTAIWLGEWSGDVKQKVQTTIATAKNSGATPIFIAYNIPARDCGGYSAGGINSPDGYRNWIRSLKYGIGSNKAVVILEPDALAAITCLSQTNQDIRYALIKDAVTTLKANAETRVYIDAGHASWIDATDMANRLKKAGIDIADGFSLNVSNFFTTGENTTYGTTISKLINNKHFVIDTSRNGNGSNGDWCNPDGRALGERPSTATGNELIDGYLWLKQPGESDGSCHGGPSAGTWWPEYALGLSQRAKY